MGYNGRHGQKKTEESIKLVNDSPEKDEQQKNDERDERLREKNEKKLAKLMKKKSKRENKSDRDVLSYEDLPLDERSEEREKKEIKLNKKRVVIACVIVFVLFIAVFLFANSDRLSIHNITNFIQYGVFNKDSDEHFPVNIQGENVSAGNFTRKGQDLCYVSDTKLQVLNNYGKAMIFSQHSFSTPILAASDKFSLLYALGGTDYRVYGDEDLIYSGTCENNILLGDINDNGYYAIVTQSDGYLAKLYVYDNENTQIYAYSFADYYITALSLSQNGKYAAVAGLSALNGDEISSVYVLDFRMDKPMYFDEFEENIIYDVCFLNDIYVSAIGNNGVRVVNSRSGNVEITDYEGRTLTSFAVNRSTSSFSVSLSRSGDGRSCDILSFNTNGTVAHSFSTELRVIDVSIYKSRIALLTSDAVYLYNKDGGLISETDAGLDPRAIVLYTSSDAYIIDASEIRSLSL